MPLGFLEGGAPSSPSGEPPCTLYIVPLSKGCRIITMLKSRFTRTHSHQVRFSSMCTRTKLRPKNLSLLSLQALAPFAVGTAVFVVHVAIIPVDGVSINPARSFGPAVVLGGNDKIWDDMVRPQCRI
jgi:hypothetical protein